MDLTGFVRLGLRRFGSNTGRSFERRSVWQRPRFVAEARGDGRKQDDQDEGTTTKSKRTRWVPVLPNVEAVFDFLKVDAAGEAKPDDAHVFSNEVGEPIRSFRTAWVKALTRARIHDYLARPAARIRQPSGRKRGALVQVKELLGHASIVTTERYNTNRAERLHAAVHVLKPVTDGGNGQPSNTQPDATNDDAQGASQSFHSNEPARIAPSGNQRVF